MQLIYYNNILMSPKYTIFRQKISNIESSILQAD